MDDLVVLDHGHGSDSDDLDRIVDAAISLLPGVRGFLVGVLSNFINPSPAGDFPDDGTLDTPRNPGDDGQPNPEGDDQGGPAGGQNDFLLWLAGRPPQAGNPALSQPVTRMDVLGQPGPEGTRRRSSRPGRFSRIRFDVNPALLRSANGRGGSTWRPPVDPDGSGGPVVPHSPIGPGGPSPVK